MITQHIHLFVLTLHNSALSHSLIHAFVSTITLLGYNYLSHFSRSFSPDLLVVFNNSISQVTSFPFSSEMRQFNIFICSVQQLPIRTYLFHIYFGNIFAVLYDSRIRPISPFVPLSRHFRPISRDRTNLGDSPISENSPISEIAQGFVLSRQLYTAISPFSSYLRDSDLSR
jgi:hypothetical protein